MRMRAVFLGVGAIALAGGAGAAIGAGTQETEPVTTVTATVSAERQAAPTPPTEPTVEQRRAMEVFEEPAVRLTEDVTSLAMPEVAEAQGVNLELGHVIDTSLGPVALAPAAGNVVCYGNKSGTGCVTVADVLAGRSIGVQLCSPDAPGVRVFGLAPDGATNLTVDLKNGSSQRVDVTSNVFAADLAGAPEALAFEKDGATIRSEISLPADAGQTCADAGQG